MLYYEGIMQKVSVIIPTYNYAHFISEAVESVLAQTFPIFEIIVVDDGSSDNTEEVVKQFGDKVKYIKQKNGGVGLARNTGAKNSGGDYIAFLDADDVWLPEKIEHQIQLFQTDDQIGLNTTAMLEFDVTGTTGRIYSEGKNGWCADSLLLLEPVAIGPGSTTLVKREVFEKIGGFDESRELYPSEDWEFCYRVAREFKLAFLSDVLVRYRNHGSNGHLNIRRFESAMFFAFSKIFNNDEREIQKLKQESYGNLHKILAGSYFQNRFYGKFLKHSIQSVWLMPKNIRHFVSYPLRYFERSNKSKGGVNEINLSNNGIVSSMPAKFGETSPGQTISVIIPTFNYGRFIAEAIESVLAQTYPILEIIVIDDGSTDDTEEVIKKFGDVRYIKQENAGVSAARNTGIEISSGNLIAFLDADDTWLPTKIEKEVARLLEDGQIGLVHCGMREFDGRTRETIALHLIGGEGWVAEDMILWEKPTVVGPGGAILVRRDVIEDVGGFDTRLKNAEDWEFCLRVALKYKVGFVAEPLVNYRNHRVNATKNVPEMERSIQIAWAKAFDTDDVSIRRLRRRSYGNLHKVLAGSYLHQGQYSGFARNLVKSLWFKPAYLGYYLSLLASGRKDR